MRSTVYIYMQEKFKGQNLRFLGLRGMISMPKYL